MKKILKHPLFITLMLFPLWGLGGFSCSKDDAPPITQENSFSCKINGELFVPEDYGSFPNSFEGIVAYISPSESNNWYFHFANGEKDIYIYITNVGATGEYNLSLSDGNGDFFEEEDTVFEMDVNGTNTPTHKSTEDSGVLNIQELELNNKIILKFDRITLRSNENHNETITLTEGKLNINLATLYSEN